MAERVHTNPSLILSAGTQIVTLVDLCGESGRIVQPCGSVGIVISAPVDLDHAYRVRFPDGVEESLRQNQLLMLAKYKEGDIGSATDNRSSKLFDRVIYRCVIGSRAYGLDDATSDIDYRGIYLPPAELHWSLSGVPEQLECHETQEVYWEIQKLIVLALKANPNVLECLYTPLVEQATPLAQELLAMRESFLSRLVYQTFNGYVMSQFKKMQTDIRNQGQVKWKHVMHLLRLLICGTQALREGHIPVRITEHRDELLAVKRGEMPWEETEKWRVSLHEKFETAFKSTRLPERPDYQKANAFLLKARHAALSEELP